MRTLIGRIAVDAGVVYIGDPCYLYSDIIDGGGLGETWEDVCDKLFKDEGPFTVIPFNGGSEGQGVISSTHWGDGVYPVYAEMDTERNTPKRIIIEFDEEEENE